ncbi:MAG: zinc ribbon domain-containing protein [Promethearchaeota archaeon]
MDDIRDKLKTNRLRITYLLAFIFSLTGAILLLSTDFLEWYDYPGIYGWISIDSDIYGPIITMGAIFLLISTFIGVVGTYNPDFVRKQTLFVGEFWATLVFIMIIIGILIAAGDLADVTSWNPNAGFYGGIIGSLLTMIFFGMAILFTRQGSFQVSKQVVIQKSKGSGRITPVRTVQKVSYCHNCGKEVSGKFCTHCGTEMRNIQEYKLPETAVPQVEHCSKCGKEVSGKFCTYCGSELRKNQEYKPPESTVPKVKYCSKCGKEVSGKFCTYCGIALK